MNDRPRDIDHIVAMHRLANDRRNAGLPVWRWRVKIKDLLGDDTSNEAAVAAGKWISNRLKHALPDLINIENGAYDEEFDEICYDLQFSETADDLNDILDALYDWADINRLWLG